MERLSNEFYEAATRRVCDAIIVGGFSLVRPALQTVLEAYETMIRGKKKRSVIVKPTSRRR